MFTWWSRLVVQVAQHREQPIPGVPWIAKPSNLKQIQCETCNSSGQLVRYFVNNYKGILWHCRRIFSFNHQISVWSAILFQPFPKRLDAPVKPWNCRTSERCWLSSASFVLNTYARASVSTLERTKISPQVGSHCLVWMENHEIKTGLNVVMGESDEMIPEQSICDIFTYM